MGWRRVVGRLLLVLAGGSALALLMFVGLPWLTLTLEPEGPPAPEAIISEVLSRSETDEEDAVVAGGAAEKGVMREPSPPVAVRTNGEEIAVLFPRAGSGETPEVDDVSAEPAEEVRQGIQDLAGEDLPPVLSPEEVAEAMAGAAQNADGAGIVAQVMPEPVEESEEPSPDILDVLTEMGGDGVQVMLPPQSATRDVQELLEALGYAPGPLDGIWGERTDAAWRNFARDAAERAARTELPKSQSEVVPVAEPSAPEKPAPSGQTVEAEGSGGRQAGETRPSTGLPRKPVVVPGTLRGVMGYRMPLVRRQGVPDQVVSGVLIPAHTTFVILKPGYWELVGLEPGEVERLRDAPAERESAAVNVKRRGEGRWNPLRLFRRQGGAVDAE